ncbi:MAG: hypothetical protein ABJK37_01975 [Paraglaciecola sp.]|uniref:hypothetical protein n=1 Tax=Paraglaciecola sp. TaxID=1920173 RepID=UPI003298C195
MSQGYHYWVQYEGVPGGEMDDDDFWYASIDDKAHSIKESNIGDLPALEWFAFGDKKNADMIYLT